MEIVTVNTSTHSSDESSASSKAFFKFDLPSLIRKMKESNSWSEGELNSKILLKSPYKQVVLTVLPVGTEISSFQSSDSISFQIIEGSLRFHTHKDSVILKKDQILTLGEKIKYSLTSSEETIFLLTLIQRPGV